MSSEFLEKIRKIIVILFVLFFSILIILITFVSLRVHAEEATIKHSYYVNTQRTHSSKSDIDENKHTYDTDLQFVMFCGSKNGDQTSTYNNVYYLYAYIKNDRFPAGAIYSVNDSIFSGHIDFSYGQYHNGDLISSEWSTYAFVFNNRYNDNGFYETIDTNVPMFDSRDHALAFCRTGDTTGLLNGGSIDNPDFEDTAYAFTGFTANNKMTANWTGTTDRSYLQDQEVEEYVRVNYYFADKEAPDTIKQADAYPDEFATADKTLTIDVSGLKPDDENWFLRYIRITPCYRQAGLGAWGDFYHGESSYVYFNQDGSIDRIDAPYIKGELSSDMERPVIVLHEAANGNPTESDFSYFEFNNAQSDYFFEMKGRWYTTNDFDLYRDKLVWKYKYSTLLKNNLSTWVSVSDNRSSVGRFQFDVLGKSSWDNLLSSYPVDDRNYIGGSYNLFNKITGYSDALETLKMLLKQPYSLFNGYEVYVRYFRYDENGGIQYSKWTHFYNNLANSDGSSGSRLDDLDNMYSENQSDKGLTDDELSDLENGGNSRNDLDAVPKNNYDYSSLENATMNFFDLLKNFGTMLGQFPSMVAAVFGFLPFWLIGLIAVAIGAVIFCRFIGR